MRKGPKKSMMRGVGLVVLALALAGASFVPTSTAGTTMICSSHTNAGDASCSGSCPSNAKVGVSMNLDDDNEPNAFAEAICDSVGVRCEPDSSGSCQAESTLSTVSGGSMSCTFQSHDPWQPDDGFDYACWHNTPSFFLGGPSAGSSVGCGDIDRARIAAFPLLGELCVTLADEEKASALIKDDAEGHTIVHIKNGAAAGITCIIDEGCAVIEPVCRPLATGFECTAFPARVT